MSRGSNQLKNAARGPPAHFNRIALSISPTEPGSINHNMVVTSTCNLIHSLFSTTRVHPDRLIYALAGLIFYSWAPLPFGGPKASPGFATFTGETTQQLLAFIVEGAYLKYWQHRGQDALDLVVSSVNKVLDLQDCGAKDTLDELLLKGMKKAGHISFYGAAAVPSRLAHVDEEDVVPFCEIGFEPRRRRMTKETIIKDTIQ